MTTPPPLHQPSPPHQPPPPHQPLPMYQQPAQGPKKTPIWVWIVAAVGGMILLLAIGLGLLGYYAVQKVKEVASNPAAAAALLAKIDPDLEVLDVDDTKKIIRVRNKRNNEEVTLNLNDILQGKMKIQHEGKNGVESFELGGKVKLPSWLPAYPGAELKGIGTGRSDKDGAGGLATFDTADPAEKVIGFYQAALQKRQFHKDEGVSASGTVVLVMKSESGDMATITATPIGDATKVTVLYGSK